MVFRKKPDAIKNATEIILKKLFELKMAIDAIDQKTVEQWVRDLVIVKTFVGLRFQEAILKKGAAIKNTNYRLADTIEESRGIDGFIGTVPVSIKPDSYEVKSALPENIDVRFIFYKKLTDGIEVDYSQVV